MGKIVRRGYVPDDKRDFSEKAMTSIRAAADDIYYLLNHGYNMKSASVFVGNHYMLSERQRLALARMVSPEEQLVLRTQKCKTVLEDGEVDGTVRDLAGLRGTYSLIDKTPGAIHLAGKALSGMNISKAVFYMDAPVSNTGRLAACIHHELSGYGFEVETEVINNVDSVLSGLGNVITGDAIILDKCISWINFVRGIIDTEFPGYTYVTL